MPYSMLPDVMEEDEWRTGQRREGLFYGFFTIFLKLAVTVALAITNFLLAWADYEPPQSTCGAKQNTTGDCEEKEYADTQSSTVYRMLRALTGPIPFAFMLAAIVC
eukprot:gene22205-29260_t